MTSTTALSLSGRCVLVTRAADEAEQWEEALVSYGASVYVYPCVRRERIDDAATRALLAGAVPGADWIVVTSAFGVTALADASVTVPASAQFAAVGPATAAVVRARFGREATVSRGGTAAALARELGEAIDATGRRCRVVIVGAADGRDDVEALAERGVQVTRADLYRTIPAPAATPRHDLAADGVTDVLLASPTAVTGVLNRGLVDERMRVYTIGPTTTAAARAAGLVVTGEASTRDLRGLMEAMQCATGT